MHAHDKAARLSFQAHTILSQVFDRRGEMRLLLLRVSTSLRTAADVGLKEDGEPGAASLKLVQCVSLEPVPPSRCVRACVRAMLKAGLPGA